MSQEALEELISQCVADVLETYDTNRSNGDDSHDLGSGERRTVHTTRECTYNEFLKCQPLNFKGRGCKVSPMVQKYGICVPYQQMHCEMPSEVCHLHFAGKSEIKKLETELWNLVVKDELDKVEKYTGELPDSIQGTRDCRSPAAVNTQRAPRAVQKTGTCFKCKSQGHFKRDFPKPKNQNRRNVSGNDEARKAYAWEEVNPTLTRMSLQYSATTRIFGGVTMSALGQTLVKVGTQDPAHNQEMAGTGKQQLHMRMGPLASQAVHRLLEIRCPTNLHMDWTRQYM
nr:hypothetical protein [Tanacetum cinerariifolium]